MKVLQYSSSCIIANHIAYISKDKKSRELFADYKERFLLIFHMISGESVELYFDFKEKRDEEYDAVISIIEGIK